MGAAGDMLAAALLELLPDREGLALINSILLADHPYDLYWYDKVIGTGFSPGLSARPFA